MEKLIHPLYEKLKEEYLKGWKTWNVNSVLSHVYMPYGLALNLCLKEYSAGGYLRESLIGRFPEEHARTPKESVHPQYHAFDDTYTFVILKWCDMEFTVESAQVGEEFYLYVVPMKFQPKSALAVLECGFLWNRPGVVIKEGKTLLAKMQGKEIAIRVTKEEIEDLNIPSMTRYLSVSLNGPTAFYTGEEKTLEEIHEIMKKKQQQVREQYSKYTEEEQELYHAMACAVTWDTIYDPKNNRVISPVSRLWSIGSGGYVLFCWDNFFASLMASFGNKELAYSNMIEIMNERTEDGFVPNFSYGTGQKSEDRSQPPVGSAMLVELYRRFGEKWLVELMYPALYQWNTWFLQNRSAENGALCWGSNPIPIKYGNRWESEGVNDTYGAALESGLDNSPMYDDIPFNRETHMLELADVGLTGLYILDCRSLITLAEILGRTGDIDELRRRKQRAEAGLETLWCEEKGFYYNRRTDNDEFSWRISPTNFYALFADNVTKERIERILKEHYYNEEEFYGEWMLPSIAHNDQAFGDQDYWRGRIWAPLNFLVYLAFRGKELDDVCCDLAEKSKHIFLKEWKEHRHVHENYNGFTGEGCDAHNSDKFYHWGALLAAIYLIENDSQEEFGRKLK
ncbi:MAG: MGH1-like glycoside hydrolase domain-containing protein [Marvinbryantia sp.]|jgi:putative isomerase